MLEAPARKPVGGGGSHSRPTSTLYAQGQQHPAQPHHQLHHGSQFQHSRRSASVNTFSTASSIPPPAAFRKSPSELRRSTSSRSGGTSSGQASGYVALLRKQKATVWCDRAQYEDPRLAAQQRAAKQRANLEVSGGRPRGGLAPGSSRSNTGISAGKVAAKIRHHGKTPVVGLTPGENHVGVGGVPLRLSATEVEAESSDEEQQASAARSHHRRTGSSGRSSNASGRRGLAYRTSAHGSMTSRHSQRWPAGDTPERAGSLAEQPGQHHQHQQQKPGDSASVQGSLEGKAQSTHSASDAEKADAVAELGNAPRVASNSLLHSALTREKSVKNPEELKRRGSVDERTATLTSQRLYIANPD